MIGGSQCVVFLFFVLSNGTMMSKKYDHVICVGLKILRRGANGFKRVRSERFDPLKTSSLSIKNYYEEGDFFYWFLDRI